MSLRIRARLNEDSGCSKTDGFVGSTLLRLELELPTATYFVFGVHTRTVVDVVRLSHKVAYRRSCRGELRM